MSIEAAFALAHPPMAVPACGQGREDKILATIAALEQVAQCIAEIRPQTIVISSALAPANRDCFAVCEQGELEGDLSGYGAPQERLLARIDTEFVDEACSLAERAMIPLVPRAWCGAPMDLATFIPLWFLNKFYTDYRLVVCGLSHLPDADHYVLGQVLGKVARDLGRSTVFIGSGELSCKISPDGPYGFAPEGILFDQRCTQLFADNDLEGLLHINRFLVEEAAETGLRSFITMAGALDRTNHSAELLSYEAPFGIGYAVAAFPVEGQSTRTESGRSPQ